MRHTRRLLLACLPLVLCGCAWVGVHTAPQKLASQTRTPLAGQADALFWQTLHGGHYDGIEQALERATAAYVRDPGDAVSAAHVGWLHIWKLAESSRQGKTAARVTDHAVLARRYFEEAVRLDPSEARFKGFLGSAMLSEGAIHQDPRLTRAGYYTLLEGVEAWPEFNLFTAGYSFSRLPADSAQFKQGLEMQWKTLELCAGQTIDRSQPDFAPFMGLATQQGPKRVCWNSWIAPHNFEGFFLNMGDMLVKAGDWQTAKAIYANARHAPDFVRWPFAGVLEQRIQQAQANVAAFNTLPQPGVAAAQPMMVASSFACMGCHQR